MATCVENPEIVQVTMNFRRDSRAFQNVFWYHSNSWNYEKMVDTMQNHGSWWADYYRNFAANELTWNNTVGKQWVDGGLEATSTCLSGCVGLYTASPPMPANVSAVLSWKTGLRGRKNRGRTYMNGLVEAVGDDNDLIPSVFMASLATIAGQLLSYSLPAGVTRVVYHCADGTQTPISTFAVDELLDSQRRRLPGRGA